MPLCQVLLCWISFLPVPLCRVLLYRMLSFVMQNVIKQRVLMMIVITKSVIKLNVVMLSAVMLSVVAPLFNHKNRFFFLLQNLSGRMSYRDTQTYNWVKIYSPGQSMFLSRKFPDDCNHFFEESMCKHFWHLWLRRNEGALVYNFHYSWRSCLCSLCGPVPQNFFHRGKLWGATISHSVRHFQIREY